jgi:hypothetical protein
MVAKNYRKLFVKMLELYRPAEHVEEELRD